MLDMAGEDLWNNVTKNTLSNFADRYRTALERVGKHALFFSEEDYSTLEKVLNAADFYLSGKLTLSDIRVGVGVSDRYLSLDDTSSDMKLIRKQIQQNKRWLTRYRNVLSTLRSRFHTGLASRVV